MNSESSKHSFMLQATVLIVALFTSLAQRGTTAQGDTSPCPSVTYLGNYPKNETLLWSENTQGLAHDDGHWFITQNEQLWRIPVETDLNADFFHISLDPPPLPPYVQKVGVPQELQDAGYNHLGDLDQVGGFLFIPLEGGPPALGVFRASDLSYVGHKVINQEKSGWVAFNPTDGLLYTSEETVESGRPLYRYELKLDVLAGTGNVEASIVFKDYFYLFESDGSPLFPRIGRYTQGGAFTPWGDLFLCAGRYSPEDEGDRRAGIFLFDPQGRLITDSYNTHDVCIPAPYPQLPNCLKDESGTFEFAFEPDFPTREEPEGVDWWDRDAGPFSPGIGGQLHVLLVDQDLSHDEIYLKHYRVDHSCCAITCPSNIVVANDPAQCGAIVNYDLPTTIKGCGIVTCTPPSGAFFTVGTTAITCSLGTLQKCGFLVTVSDTEAPSVTSSVTSSLLWRPDHNLVDVGLAASVANNCSSPPSIQVLVFANENDETPLEDGNFSPDAKNIAVGTLRLRAERIESANGRIYLIVVKASDASLNVGLSVSTVVVPRSQKAADISSVNEQAIGAKAYTLSHGGTPPPAYSVIGDGPVIGSKQ